MKRARNIPGLVRSAFPHGIHQPLDRREHVDGVGQYIGRRARERLAGTLVAAGRLDEAAREFAEMLTLNENDNQGVRYTLLPVLLALSRLDEARALLKRYENDLEFNAVFAWGYSMGAP